MLFGELMNNIELSSTVTMLYTNATVETTRSTSKVGQNYFSKFTTQSFGFPYMPHLHSRVSLKGLLLCFFAGSLFTDAKRFQSSTVKNYVGHVRAAWTKQGAELSQFDNAVLRRVLRGVSSLRPAHPDRRVAFLLPHYSFPSAFVRPLSKNLLLFKAAVVFGFLGMFRYSTFAKLSKKSIVLVTVSGRELRLSTGSNAELTALTREYKIFGFYFHFSSKFHAHARAYFCSLKGFAQPWANICPLQLLLDLARSDLLSAESIFKRSVISAHALGLYMRYVSNSTTTFSPHSLRIGGHTFYSVHNMHEDFIHFLGRRQISRASQLYYRARATDNINRLSRFFAHTSTPVLAEGGLFGTRAQIQNKNLLL